MLCQQIQYDISASVNSFRKKPCCIRGTGNIFLTDEFYEAFGITDGRLYVAPSQRIKIW